jgi:hypothetical protein
LGVSPTTVRKRELALLGNAWMVCMTNRAGAPRSIGDDQVERVIVKTLEETPSAATHCSTRSKGLGVASNLIPPRDALE